MGRYISIASIKLEHDYYDHLTNQHLSLEPIARTMELMRKRRVLFRQTAPNEWQCIVEEGFTEFMEDDVLEISIKTDDPNFLHTVALEKDYNPQMLYQISPEQENTLINEEFRLTPLPGETKHQGEFCRLKLKLKQLNGRLSSDPTLKYTIKFCSHSYYWEYLFIFRDENDLRGKDLALETTPKNEVTFNAPEKYEENSMFGKNVWRIVSKEKTKALENYHFQLTLYDNSANAGGRKLISRFLPFPKPGKFRSDNPDVLKEIYYL